MKTKFYWHIHPTILVEPLTTSIENRIEFIKENGPKEEIKLKLRLLRSVKGNLPEEVIKAWETYDKAREDYNKTLEKHKKEIEELHKKECPDCPWNGKSIFNDKQES